MELSSALVSVHDVGYGYMMYPRIHDTSCTLGYGYMMYPGIRVHDVPLDRPEPNLLHK